MGDGWGRLVATVGSFHGDSFINLKMSLPWLVRGLSKERAADTAPRSLESEASQKDPLEGEPVESDIEHPSQPIGELQSKLREVIGG
jgi:hypothetical protein